MQRRPYTLHYTLNGLLLFAALVWLWGCSPTRRLGPDEKLLNKVYIETDKKGISESEVRSYLRQQPNRKLLGFWRFYLQIYNTVDPAKATRDHERRLEKKKKRIEKRENRRGERCARREARKLKRGIKYECPQRETDDIEAKSFREWVQGIGEPPAVYDSVQTPISSKQIAQYLSNNGYFFATVKDSTVSIDEKRVNTYYKIKAGPRYAVTDIKYEAPDSAMQTIITLFLKDRAVQPFRYFDASAISAERDRLTKLFRNTGYYFFSNEFIKIYVDTVYEKDNCTLKFVIANPRVPDPANPDSTVESTHKIYKIRNVIVNTQYVSGQEDYSSYVVREYEGVKFLYPDSSVIFRPRAIHHHLVIKNTQLDEIGAVVSERYSDNRVDYTLTRLGDLRVFKFINIQFLPTDTTAENAQLDCFILLNPAMRRSFGIETQGTNTGGNLGISANFSFINKNLFKGAEYFEFKINGGLEAQRLVTDDTEENSGIRNTPFNTQELGVSMTFNIPRGLFPINYFVKKQFKNPKTQITTSYNYQQRPQYTRNLYTLAFGWSWRQNFKTNITYNPIEANYIEANITSDAFDELLGPKNSLLRSSFDDAFIENGRVAITWTNQQIGKRTNYYFWRIGGESAGLLFNTFLKKDPADSIKKIVGVASAQYARIDFEIFPNIYLNSRNALAFRAYLGMGSAYGNSKAIPFARAFFSGGSNGMRAWIQRALGPGIYNKYNPDNQVDQVGDIKIEFNAEYRVKLFSFFEFALFTDIGNVWLMNPDPNRPGANITKDFYKQFGVGYGAGLRLDLSFFLLRLDFARRLIDPGQQYGEYFLSPFKYDKYIPEGKTDPVRKNPIVFNLGIGYPF